VPLVVASVLGVYALRSILGAAGHQAVPLDDAFIHFQYAKRLAHGSFFTYAPGRGYTTGATSLIWPLVLAPFYALGFRDLAIIDVAWLLGALAHAALAVETARVASRLTSPTIGATAGAMTLGFSAFTWFAWSGMETVPFAWILLRCVRLASDLCEPASDPGGRVVDPARTRRALVIAGVLAPLVRPEGVLGAFIACGALTFEATRRHRANEPRRDPRASLALTAAPLLACLALPALHLALAGHAASSTATVKWLAMSPYLDAGALWEATLGNVRLLVGSVLDGGDFTTIFLPEGSAYLFALGAPALVVAACRRRLPLTCVAVGLVAAGALIPCTYGSFLWNRLRYVWPFSPAHFVMVACLASEAALAARRVWPRLAFLGPALGGAFAGALATHVPFAVRDLAQSAAAIDQQQVALGRWVAETLPKDALVGVNDTGAIAYIGDRATFDIVGLTTEGEARYWVAGAGSRFEHYERLAPEARPTHFIVYPPWMAAPELLGRVLTQTTVVDQSILGGATMVACEARWTALYTGERPMTPPAGACIDEVDVADLESERDHGYVLGPATDTDDVVMTTLDPDHGLRAVTDGGRLHRSRDRFRLRFGATPAATLVLRLGAEEATAVRVAIDGEEQATVHVVPGPFEDLRADVVASPGLEHTVTLTAVDAPFGSFHAWLYEAK
jgi:hypothetical protein